MAKRCNQWRSYIRIISVPSQSFRLVVFLLVFHYYSIMCDGTKKTEQGGGRLMVVLNGLNWVLNNPT